jgi:glucose-6-phosphate isomerase
MARTEGWKTFEIPPDVGGRFSVLSPVGLLPLATAGIPIGMMLEGAAVSLDTYTRLERTNDALRYATARTLLHRKGTVIEVMSTFHPHLNIFCEWWKQLAGESEGKKGRGLFPASAVMTTDLHSLGQLLQQGTRSILETFLVASGASGDLEIPGGRNDLDGLNYLAGTSLSEVNRRAFEGTRDAHSAGRLPVITIEMPSFTPETIGALFVFFEIAVAVSARLLRVNPFDQPGVDEYKSRMLKLLGKPGA